MMNVVVACYANSTQLHLTMPQEPTRELLLRQIQLLIRLEVLNDGVTNHQTSEDLDFLLLILYLIKTTRYLKPRVHISYRTPLHEWFISLNRPRTFRLALRMSRESFWALVQLISPFDMFHDPVQRRPQAPIELQLAVFLFRLGMSDAGSSLGHTALSLGLGEGTVHEYTLRAIGALQQLKKLWIRWPNADQRAVLKDRIGQASKGLFTGCIGFVDGTFINLRYAPEVDHYSYYNRKNTYAVNAMVVCTDEYQITYVRAGDTSAVHDSRVFRLSLLSQYPALFFEEDEYLLGDSAYTPTAHMVPPYKNPRARGKFEKRFNYALSQRRIIVEHTFGLLKARFPALTSIPVRIRDRYSHGLVVNWFEAGCVLHNFLLARKDEMKWAEETEWQRIMEDIHADSQYDGEETGPLINIANDNDLEPEEENYELRERLLLKVILANSK